MVSDEAIYGRLGALRLYVRYKSGQDKGTCKKKLTKNKSKQIQKATIKYIVECVILINLNDY